jgi:hypothetical protein
MEFVDIATASPPPARAVSPRCAAIVAGLIATGRAERMPVTDGSDFIVLRKLTVLGEFYWITRDGGMLFVGTTLDEAEPLQPGFVASMAKIGGTQR